MPPRVCQHDPDQENPTVNALEESSSYKILYCAVCKKTEIYREGPRHLRPPLPAPASNVPTFSPPKKDARGNTPQGRPPIPPSPRRPSPAPEDDDDSSSEDSDSDSDFNDVRSGIDKIYAQLEAIRKKQAQPASPTPKPIPRSSSLGLSKADVPSPDLRPKASTAAPPARRLSAANASPAEGPSRPTPAPLLSRVNSTPASSKDRPVEAKAHKVPASPLDHPVGHAVPHIGSLDDSERVTMMKYDVTTKVWKESDARMVIANTPFQEGNLRAAFHCVDVTVPSNPRHIVCKMSKDPKEDQKTYFVDVEMQCLAQKIAEEFNKRKPPKQVFFLDAYLIKCLQRKGKPILAVEPYLHGKYVKHTNNFGFVSKEDRNTPQAFSHFSYCYTQGQTLVCDIQGVDDFYTDPQIHSRDGKGWGLGNLGVKGMLKFFETHHCNAICQYLRLPPNKPKDEDKGTMIPKAMSKGNAVMPPKVS